MCGSSMHSLAVSKETRYGRQELIANKCWVKTYKTNIQHSYCADSQRYGVIPLVNSPPSTNNIAYALFCSFKRKLNQKGGNSTHKNKWDQMCGSSMHSLAVSKEIRHGRPELFANKWWVSIYKTNIQHSD